MRQDVGISFEFHRRCPISHSKEVQRDLLVCEEEIYVSGEDTAPTDQDHPGTSMRLGIPLHIYKYSLCPRCTQTAHIQDQFRQCTTMVLYQAAKYHWFPVLDNPGHHPSEVRICRPNIYYSSWGEGLW